MTNANDARRAHDVVDGLFAGRILSRENEQLLRSFLPELPKRKTLEELRREVYDVWAGTNGNEWPDDMYCDLENWLYELHVQLQGLRDTPAAVPALPVGMRLADHPVYGRVVASPGTIPDGRCQIFVLDSGTKTGVECEFVHPDTLMLIDAEPAKPARPEFLETEADYAAAPDGTIVACDDSPPWYKFDSAWLSTITHGRNDVKDMTGVIREVLRWGWGE